MKTYFGYIRVSTAKQGEQGVSLQEQKSAITRYAERNGLAVAQWFEERETAAKRGRPIFNQMLRFIKQGKAHGLVIHKIDRSARNLRDWADLGELIDAGIEVHFANESLDLHSRGGRLSADIQAVVAADYIRNLREETRKGFYGRIKQGVYPLPAPLGYLDRGAGKPKDLDPVRAPLVKRTFTLYASGRYNLEQLLAETGAMGLHNRRGSPLSMNGLSVILNNPFYLGLIRLKRSGETFQGAHPPLITKSLFDRVQLVLRGKMNARSQTHDFRFRRLLTCAHCQYALIGEKQKRHAYYRCHTRDCETKCIREETVDDAFSQALEPLQFSADERVTLHEVVGEVRADLTAQWEAETDASRLQLGNLRERLDRLTDAYVDQLIERPTFEQRRASILMQQAALQDKIGQPKEAAMNRLTKFLELTGDAYYIYRMGLPEETRDLLRIVTSNRTVSEKTPVVTLAPPFQEVAERHVLTNGAPCRDRHRTLKALVRKLADWFVANPADTFEALSVSSRDDIRADDDLKMGDAAA
jgi:site-specific DNA recombinase